MANPEVPALVILNQATCPSGSEKQNNNCIAKPICPDGIVWDDIGKKCNITANCEGASTFLDSIKSCITTPNCVSGTTWNDELKECKSLVECEGNSKYNDIIGACVALPPCGSGRMWDTELKKCSPIVSCPENTIYDTNIKSCVSLPKCSNGTTWSTTSYTCEGNITQTCPDGLTYDGTNCIVAIPPIETCPVEHPTQGYRYVENDNKCFSCPTGYSSIINLNSDKRTYKCMISVSEISKCPADSNWDSIGKICISKASFKYPN